MSDGLLLFTSQIDECMLFRRAVDVDGDGYKDILDFGELSIRGRTNIHLIIFSEAHFFLRNPPIPPVLVQDILGRA